MKSFFLIHVLILVVLLASTADAKKKRKHSESRSKSEESEEQKLTEKKENMTKITDEVKSELEDCLGSTDLTEKLENITNDQNNTELTGATLGEAIDAVSTGRDLEDDVVSTLFSCFMEARRKSTNSTEDFVTCSLEDILDDCESSTSKSESRKRRPRPGKRGKGKSRRRRRL